MSYYFFFRSLPLRQDLVAEVDCKDTILNNSKIIEEDYFVAPPGNIPLEGSDYDLQSKIQTKT